MGRSSLDGDGNRGVKRRHDEEDHMEGHHASAQVRDNSSAGFQVKDSGGEVSMSIEETNKMRIALGLKPLNLEGPKKKSDVPKEVEEARARKAEEERQAKAEELAARIAAKRDKRKLDDKLKAVKTLGEADDVDDTAAWVERTRQLEEERMEQLRRKAQEEEEKRQQQAADSDDDERAALAAGLKVKADLEEIVEGDTVIMTLEDAPILNDKMQLNEEEDVLINVNMREQYKRDKARRLAGKPAKALFGEDGKVRKLLDKYDEEEDQEAVQLDAEGAIDLEKQRRQEAIKQKLAAGSGVLENAETIKQTAAEFYTADEAAALFKPKKKKKKKVLRKKEDEEGLDLDALEAEAAAAGDTGLGSRAARGSRREQEAAALKEEASRKRQKFDKVLEQANYASLALKAAPAADVDENLDDELYESLQRAQRAAQKAAPSNKESEETLAEVARKRRQEEDAKAKARAQQQGGLAFTDTGEFVRQVVVQGEEDEGGYRSRAPKAKQETDVAPSAMDVDEDPANGDAGGAARASDKKANSNWVTEEEVIMREVEEVLGISVDPAGAAKEDAAEKLVKEAVTRERASAVGLGGTLELLRSKGELKTGVESVQWAGRTNDMKKVKLQRLDDVYNDSSDYFEKAVETALTVKDHLGRVLTPKERFRQLCHGFHGIHPSKNKKDAKMRKDAEELAKRKQATTDSVDHNSVDTLKKIQAATHAPYVVLSGQLRPGQISDPTSEYATGDKSALPGTASPLLGDKKVKTLLGIDKPQIARKSKKG